MSNSVRMAGGVVEQGTDEALAYRMDFSRLVDTFGEPVSVASCRVYDKRIGRWVDEKLTSEASLEGTIATSKIFSNPVENRIYQLNIAVNFPNGRVVSGYIQIVGKR